MAFDETEIENGYSNLIQLYDEEEDEIIIAKRKFFERFLYVAS